METYLRLKNRTTYFRRRVPPHLRSAIGAGEITLRIGVINRKQAIVIGHAITSQCSILFQKAELNLIDGTMIQAELKRLIGHTKNYLHHASKQHRNRMSLDRQFLGGEVGERIQIECELAAQLVDAHSRGVYAYQNDFVLERLADSGLSPEIDDSEYNQLAGDLTLTLALNLFEEAIANADRNGLQETKKLQLSKWRSQAKALQDQLYLNVEPTIQPAAASIIQTVVPAHIPTAKPGISEHVGTTEPIPSVVEVITNTEQLFSHVFDGALADRIASKSLKETAQRDQIQIKNLWLDIVGDRSIESYNKADMRLFVSTIKLLPRIYWKSDEDRKLSISEVIADRKAKNIHDKISDKTVNKHLSIISTFFQYLKTSGQLPRDHPEFWSGMRVKITGGSRRSAKEDRPSFTDEQVKKIFEHPVYRGRSPGMHFNKAGDYIHRDSLYWAPLLAAYTLTRREEFSALQVGDIKEVTSSNLNVRCWCIDLTAAGKRIKTHAGRRIIPIHSSLLELGFVKDMVKGRKRDEMLFPDLNDNNAHRAFGAKLGGRFRSLLNHQQIELTRDDGTSADGAFHSLRHNGITKLNSVCDLPYVISYLVGHDAVIDENGNQIESITKRYTKSFDVDVTLPIIQKLVMPIDIEALKSSVDTAQKMSKLIDIIM